MLGNIDSAQANETERQRSVTTLARRIWTDRRKDANIRGTHLSRVAEDVR